MAHRVHFKKMTNKIVIFIFLSSFIFSTHLCKAEQRPLKIRLETEEFEKAKTIILNTLRQKSKAIYWVDRKEAEKIEEGLKNKLRENESNFNSKVNHYQERLSKLNSERAILEEKVADIEKEKKDIETEIKKIKEELESSRAKESHLKENINKTLSEMKAQLSSIPLYGVFATIVKTNDPTVTKSQLLRKAKERIGFLAIKELIGVYINSITKVKSGRLIMDFIKHEIKGEYEPDETLAKDIIDSYRIKTLEHGGIEGSLVYVSGFKVYPLKPGKIKWQEKKKEFYQTEYVVFIKDEKDIQRFISYARMNNFNQETKDFYPLMASMVRAAEDKNKTNKKTINTIISRTVQKTSQIQLTIKEEKNKRRLKENYLPELISKLKVYKRRLKEAKKELNAKQTTYNHLKKEYHNFIAKRKISIADHIVNNIKESLTDDLIRAVASLLNILKERTAKQAQSYTEIVSMGILKGYEKKKYTYQQKFINAAIYPFVDGKTVGVVLRLDVSLKLEKMQVKPVQPLKRPKLTISYHRFKSGVFIVPIFAFIVLGAYFLLRRRLLSPMAKEKSIQPPSTENKDLLIHLRKLEQKYEEATRKFLLTITKGKDNIEELQKEVERKRITLHMLYQKIKK